MHELMHALGIECKICKDEQTPQQILDEYRRTGDPEARRKWEEYEAYAEDMRAQGWTEDPEHLGSWYPPEPVCTCPPRWKPTVVRHPRKKPKKSRR